MGAQMSAELAQIAESLSAEYSAEPCEDGGLRLERNQIASDQSLEILGAMPLTWIQLMEQMRRFCKDISLKWKVLLGLNKNRIRNILKAPQSLSVQQLSDSARQVVWNWSDVPSEFFHGRARCHSLERERTSATRPLDHFLISVAGFQEQGVVDDICRRIWLSCLATLIQGILPEGVRLSRQGEIRSHLVNSGLASPEVLDVLKDDLAGLYFAGRRYNMIVHNCGEGSLVYIPQFSRHTWERYVPLDPVKSCAVLSGIRASLCQKTSEVWAGKDGRCRPRSANEVVQCLFTYFRTISSLPVSFESGGDQASGNAPTHFADDTHPVPGNEQQSRHSNRAASGPTNRQHRVRKANPRAQRRAATGPTQPRRLVPGPRQGQSPAGRPPSTGDSGGSCSQDDGYRPTRRGGNTATEHEASNGYERGRISTGQGDVYAAHALNHRYKARPTHSVAVLGSGSGIPNDDNLGRPHTTSNIGSHQDCPGVPGPTNEGSNELASGSLGSGMQLPPLLGASQSVGPLARNNWGSNYQPIVAPYLFSGPTLNALTSSSWSAGRSPANHSAFHAYVPSNGFPGFPPPPPDNVARPSNSTGQPELSAPTSHTITTGGLHGLQAGTPNETGGGGARCLGQLSTHWSNHNNPAFHQLTAHGYSGEQRNTPVPVPLEPPAFSASEGRPGGIPNTLCSSGGGLTISSLGSPWRAPPAPTSTVMFDNSTDGQDPTLTAPVNVAECPATVVTPETIPNENPLEYMVDMDFPYANMGNPLDMRSDMCFTPRTGWGSNPLGAMTDMCF